MVAQQEQQFARPRKLGSVAEAAAPAVVHGFELAAGVRERFDAGHAVGRLGARALAQGGHEPLRRSHDLLPFGLPHARDLEQHVDEPGALPPGRRREIRAAEEGLEIGREPHAHGPAARAGRGLHEGHVDAVHVGPFFAIDLHRHELAVEDGCHVEVLERLVRHHVAPVARGVADREKNRLVLQARACEGLVSPGIPVHRVLGVLQQIGALLACQAVGHLPSIAAGQEMLAGARVVVSLRVRRHQLQCRIRRAEAG